MVFEPARRPGHNFHVAVHLVLQCVGRPGGAEMRSKNHKMSKTLFRDGPSFDSVGRLNERIR